MPLFFFYLAENFYSVHIPCNQLFLKTSSIKYVYFSIKWTLYVFFAIPFTTLKSLKVITAVLSFIPNGLIVKKSESIQLIIFCIEASSYGTRLILQKNTILIQTSHDCSFDWV